MRLGFLVRIAAIAVRSLSFVLVAALCSAGNEACSDPSEPGTVVTLNGRAVDLPPHEKLYVKVDVHYTVVKLPTSLPRDGKSRAVSPQNVTDVLSAPEHLVWDFVVPDNHVAEMKPFRFTFPKRLGPAPKGSISHLTFAVIFSRERFPRASRRRFAVPITADIAQVSQCLRIEGGPGGTTTIGIAPDCGSPPPGASSGH